MRHSTLFAGKRILVLEDEYLLSDEARRMLLDLGAAVIGPTHSVGAALEHIEEGSVDAAILDTGLAGELAFSVADRLDGLGIPYVFATGDATATTARYRGFVLAARADELENIATALFGGISGLH